MTIVSTFLHATYYSAYVDYYTASSVIHRRGFFPSTVWICFWMIWSSLSTWF